MSRLLRKLSHENMDARTHKHIKCPRPHCCSRHPAYYNCPPRKLAYVVKPDVSGLLITQICSSAAHSSPSRSIAVTLARCTDSERGHINTNVPHQRSEVTWRCKNPFQELRVGPSGRGLHWHNRELSLVADQYSQIHTGDSKQGVCKHDDRVAESSWYRGHIIYPESDRNINTNQLIINSNNPRNSTLSHVCQRVRRWG